MQKRCLHASRCPGTNFSAHMKQSPLLRRSTISVGVNLLMIDWLTDVIDVLEPAVVAIGVKDPEGHGGLERYAAGWVR
jgi:SpoU rRNA methylase family enzyme